MYLSSLTKLKDKSRPQIAVTQGHEPIHEGEKLLIINKTNMKPCDPSQKV